MIATHRFKSWALGLFGVAALARAAKARPLQTALALGLFGLLILVAYYALAINRPRDFGEQTWLIERGDTLGHIAAQLLERGVVAETLSLRLLARQGDLGRQIRAGEYRIPEGASLREFLRRIVDGKGQVGIKVTILEGWTFRQMRAHLRQAAGLKQTTASMTDAQIMAKLGQPDLHPEGQFFPDTYHYLTGESDLSVYREAFQLMREKLDFAWEKRADATATDGSSQPLENKHQALILASIIEKESYIAEEKGRIGGVFHNRLKIDMRLQADPTVIYGLGAAYRGNITRAHLKKDTPYNTYTRKGLPPTPISLPGNDSLMAATRPSATGAYYFVAKGGGLHTFSTTLKEHNRAVRRYVRARKSAGGG